MDETCMKYGGDKSITNNNELHDLQRSLKVR